MAATRSLPRLSGALFRVKATGYPACVKAGSCLRATASSAPRQPIFASERDGSNVRKDDTSGAALGGPLCMKSKEPRKIAKQPVSAPRCALMHHLVYSSWRALGRDDK